MGLIGVLVYLATVLACNRKKKKKKNPSPIQHELSSITVDSVWSFHRNVHISMDEISKATCNFSPELIIDDGESGLVYKAHLSCGLVVAIRNLSPDNFHHGLQQFRAEVETLGKLRHRNIVKILGSLASGANRLLVYEFLERGRLDFWLHGDDSETLPWETRVNIIKGVANGLCYLHGLENPIVHRNIKSSNVLLDSEFEAHIWDFGLAKELGPKYNSQMSSGYANHGYMPPEYIDGVCVATVKSDVYSFGVLMLETVTGNHPNYSLKLGNKQLGLVEWAKKMIAQNCEMDMIDPNICRDGGISEVSVKEYFEIACMCCSELQKDRPVMTVVGNLLDRMPT